MKRCLSSLDKPTLIFGLEAEDIAVLSLAAGLTTLFFDLTVPAIIFFGGWVLLRFLKKDKPPGYILHFLYNHGLSLQGLIPPPRRVSRYCVYDKGRRSKGKIDVFSR